MLVEAKKFCLRYLFACREKGLDCVERRNLFLQRQETQLRECFDLLGKVGSGFCQLKARQGQAAGH